MAEGPIDPSRQDFKPEDSVGFLMRRIVTYVAQEVEREMEPYGLTEAQWKPLLRLYLRQAGTVAELARCCVMDAGSMTRLLDRMEAKGLLARVRSSEDRRVVNIVLTVEGERAGEQIPAILTRVQNRVLQGFSEDEYRALQGFLRRILDNVQTGQPDNA
jgi:DNA-binding MarR family transcriptional regulator